MDPWEAPDSWREGSVCYCGFMLRVYCAGPRDVSSWSSMASGPQKRVDWFVALSTPRGREAQQHIEALYSGREYIAALGPAFSWLALVIKARLSGCLQHVPSPMPVT